VTDYKTKATDVIKELRQASGLTQEDVAQEGSENEICTTRHYQDIEAGKYVPGHDILLGILERVKSNISEYEAKLHGVDLQQFNADAERVWDACVGKDFDSGDTLLAALKQKPYCNAELFIVQQKVLLLEGIIISGKYRDYPKARAIYTRALRLTCHKKLYKNDVLQIKDIYKYEYTQNEIRLLGAIGASEAHIRNYKLACKIYDEIYSLLNNFDKYYDVKKKSFPTLCYNHSRGLNSLKNHKRALDVADTGISFAREIKEQRMVGYLLGCKAWAMFELKLNDYEPVFKEAYMMLEMFGYTSSMKTFKAYAEKCEVALGD